MTGISWIRERVSWRWLTALMLLVVLFAPYGDDRLAERIDQGCLADALSDVEVVHGSLTEFTSERYGRDTVRARFFGDGAGGGKPAGGSVVVEVFPNTLHRWFWSYSYEASTLDEPGLFYREVPVAELFGAVPDGTAVWGQNAGLVPPEQVQGYMSITEVGRTRVIVRVGEARPANDEMMRRISGRVWSALDLIDQGTVGDDAGTC